MQGLLGWTAQGVSIQIHLDQRLTLELPVKDIIDFSSFVLIYYQKHKLIFFFIFSEHWRGTGC